VSQRLILPRRLLYGKLLDDILVSSNCRRDNMDSLPVLSEGEQRHILAIAHYGVFYTRAVNYDYNSPQRTNSAS
jgi:hypothetical protein